jgi:hypothetical protein
MCTYLLDLLLVPLLEAGDVASSLLGFLDFLPGLHLLLLQQGDSVREQLGVPLDAAGINKWVRLRAAINEAGIRQHQI